MKAMKVYKRFLIVLMSFGLFSATAQTPYISGISKLSGTVGETVVISGGNFSTTASNWKVSFGGVEADVSNATAIALTTTVPAGATTDNLVVTDVAGNRVVYSNEIFYISFGGVQGSFDTDKLGTLYTQDSDGKQVQDLCVCDFDRDGDNDVAVTHANDGSNLISVFENTTALAGAIDFDAATVTIDLGSYNSINIDCADLNGDRDPDIVVSSANSSGDRIFIAENTGSMTFGAPTFYNIPRVGNTPEGLRRRPGKVSINDMDLDGRADIVVLIASENTIDIFRNTGTGTSMAFNSSPFQLEVLEAENIFGLDVVDMNNDGLPDIGVGQDLGEDLFILENQSSPGSLSFKETQQFEISGSMRHLKFGDFDEDGYNDAAFADLNGNAVHIVRNNTSEIGGDISFVEGAETISSVTEPWGLDVGDVEGDGDLDIIVSSNEISATSLFIIENNGSLSGSLFESNAIQIQDLTSNSKHVKLADLNGDARPDFVFTHNSSSNADGELGALLNNNCITPVITPDNEPTLLVCANGTIDLTATMSAGYDYVWNDGTTDVGGTSDTHTVNSPDDGNYTVTIDAPGCESVTSNVVAVEFTVTVFQSPTITPQAGTVCTSTDLNFTLTDYTPAEVDFFWSGPNGFTSNEQSPTITNATAINSGEYSFYMVGTGAGIEGCTSPTSTTTFTISNVPSITLINDDGIAYCDDGLSSIDMSITDVTDKGTFNFQWWLDDVALPGEEGLTINVSNPGNYKATITSAEDCTLETADEVILELTTPTSIMESDTIKCEGSDITFEANSLFQVTPGVSALHNWDFGDDSTTVVAEDQTIYAYSQSGNFTASLNTKYDVVTDENCNYTADTQNMLISSPPSEDNRDLIFSQGSDSTNFLRCPSGFIRVFVTGGPYESIQWRLDSEDFETVDDNEHTSDTFRFDEDDDVYATLVDELGCEYETDLVSITTLEGAGVFITSTTNTISNDGEVKTLEMDQGQIFVELSVNGTSPIWSPAGIFEDTTLNTVQAYPLSASQPVYVTATDAFNCTETDSLRINTPPLQVDRNFSPNGDGINDCWEVANARGNQCEITIFDSKGRKIKMYNPNSNPFSDDSCVWDGTSDGNSKMPNGVYYYVMKCNGDPGNPEQAITRNSGGTILLAR